jgi:hypothetical protein
VVVVDVELVARDHELDPGAELARVRDLGPGLHAEGLGLDARRDADGGVGEHRHHADGLAPEPGLGLLLDRGEVRVEVDEQGAEGHRTLIGA